MFHRMMNYGELDARPTVVLTRDMIKKSMPKFKRHDDLIVIQENAWNEFKRNLPIPVVRDENSPFSIDEDELASLVCQTIQKPPCHRLAIEKPVINDDYRSPNVELILGNDSIVTHRDNHILYQFDVTKCMFSFGNVHEKMRMAELNCSEETVVDLFAGIGYFTLPLLVHAKATHVYACEWNPHAVEALRKNLTLNKIDPTRYTVIEGDNRSNRPSNVAQRVLLGILPSCADWMQTALDCLDKKTGGILHCHDLVDTKPASQVEKVSVLAGSPEASSSMASKPNTSDSQSLLNQSITSSSSSHSTIERLSPSLEDKLQASDSDKDTNSPVLLEKPSSFPNSPNSSAEANVSLASHETASLCSHQDDTSADVSPITMADLESSIYEERGLALIERIREELDSYDLIARVVHIQPVKSYAPHVNHVVFDIRIEPKMNQDVIEGLDANGS